MCHFLSVETISALQFVLLGRLAAGVARLSVKRKAFRTGKSALDERIMSPPRAAAQRKSTRVDGKHTIG